MKTLLRGITIASLLLMLAAPLFAGGAQEVDFLGQLEEELQEQGLSEEEAQAIAGAASSYDWSGANAADPALIAEALADTREDGNELAPDENAQLALELAKNAARLQEEGYSRSEVAQATLGAVEQLQEQIRAWQDGDQDEPLGETVRNAVSDTAQSQARERETTSEDDSGADDAEQTPADEEAPVETGRGAGEAGNR